ncbi:anthranilate synthase, component I [Pelagirhabdus alkalitolerans]|uniref:Anthranilate synthase component 1 n=1 Tax=Pelagirhabdus alkalitolerans TaxID=1612202 RepID=A0A1G6GJ59_9BACI|nr:anthranilate synthase component I [Pelagirhabdus alkalitolerans]SDB82062.1 anthranilate synthase, component I [Pelagirhabdus alkalitolerans]
MHYQTRQLNGDTLTPIAVYNRIKGEKKFILESSSHHGDKGRYSFIGANPFKEVIGTLNETTVKTASGIEQIDAQPIEVLKRHIPNVDLNLPYAYYGGAVGYIGYDMIRGYEDIGNVLDDPIDMPDVHMMFYQDTIVFDHQKQTVTLIALNYSGERTQADLSERLDEMEAQIAKAVDYQPDQPLTLDFSKTIEKQTFKEMVNKAKQHIIDGDIFQVVLSQTLIAQFDTDPFQFYRRLRVSNPSPYMFYIDFSEYCLLGASPESLIKVTGKEIVTNPIAGTRPRGKTISEDEALAEELLSDEKERAEHKMLVDLSRNDLGRVCEVGSIQLPTFMTIERYQHVMHIVSVVTGQLHDDMHSLDALVATLPAGTVSGAPKIRAMQIINDLEDRKRGAYSGSAGYINLNGDLDLALAIRTMVIKDQHAYVRAGAGIVYDSDPESEYEETLNKAKSLLEVAKS